MPRGEAVEWSGGNLFRSDTGASETELGTSVQEIAREGCTLERYPNVRSGVNDNARYWELANVRQNIATPNSVGSVIT